MADKPTVWALTGDRVGDNRQVEALAASLEWGFEEKRLAYNRLYGVPNWVLGPSLGTLRRGGKSALSPPWPNLVIGAGRRSVAPALWIKRQSGGSAKIVRIGRPRAALRHFDLVLTTPQYGLPARHNVVCLPLPRSSPELLHAPNVAG